MNNDILSETVDRIIALGQRVIEPRRFAFHPEADCEWYVVPNDDGTIGAKQFPKPERRTNLVLTNIQDFAEYIKMRVWPDGMPEAIMGGWPPTFGVDINPGSYPRHRVSLAIGFSAEYKNLLEITKNQHTQTTLARQLSTTTGFPAGLLQAVSRLRCEERDISRVDIYESGLEDVSKAKSTILMQIKKGSHEKEAVRIEWTWSWAGKIFDSDLPDHYSTIPLRLHVSKSSSELMFRLVQLPHDEVIRAARRALLDAVKAACGDIPIYEGENHGE
jgi:hypothetical protein